MHQQQVAFEKIVGLGEITRYKQFLLFPQCFQLNQITVSEFVYIFDFLSLFAVELEEPEVTHHLFSKGKKIYKSSERV